MLVFKTTLTKYCLLVIFVMVPWNTNIATIHSGTFHDLTADSTNNTDIKVIFPRAFGIAVNQVGYMQGSSLEATDGPWRAGIRRDFDVRDYRPIAEVGKAVGTRFMSLFALAEMEKAARREA